MRRPSERLNTQDDSSSVTPPGRVGVKNALLVADEGPAYMSDTAGGGSWWAASRSIPALRALALAGLSWQRFSPGFSGRFRNPFGFSWRGDAAPPPIGAGLISAHWASSMTSVSRDHRSVCERRCGWIRRREVALREVPHVGRGKDALNVRPRLVSTRAALGPPSSSWPGRLPAPAPPPLPTPTSMPGSARKPL